MSVCDAVDVFPGKLLAFLLMIVMAVIGICYINYDTSHGLEKHGSGAAATRLLCDPDNFSADEAWFNEDTGRCAYLTKEDSGKVFVQIIEDGQNSITEYVKDNIDVARSAVERYGFSQP